MKILSLILAAAIFSASASAQGFFDDKKISKPVPHMSKYNNDEWTLKKVVRDEVTTVFVFNYHTAYRSQGSWTCLEVDDCLINPDSGEKYPVISSTGIPKSPAKHIWNEGADQNQEVVVYFPAIPDGVKTLDSTFGIYDIDISSVPIKATPGSTSVFPQNCKSQNGTLEVYNVSRSGNYVTVVFYYTSRSYGDWCQLSENPVIHNNADHTTYPMQGYAGISMTPDKTNIGKDQKMAFMISFKVPATDRLDSFDFIYGPNSGWNTSNIPLK